MQLLLVISSYLPNVGGLQSATSRLAVGLSRRGDKVQVLTQRYPRSLPSTDRIDGIDVRRLLFLTPRLRHLQSGRADLFLAGLFYFPWSLIQVLGLIARERPKIVNLHFVGAPALFLLIARWLVHFRYVVSLHGDDVEGLPRGSWFDRWVFRATLRRADAVTACSRYLLEEARALEPSIATKARVIHNGVDLGSQVEGPNRTTILAVGRLMPKKGFDVLVSAFAAMDTEQRPASLCLIGDGPERDSLKSLAHDLGLNGFVAFLGSQSHERSLSAIGASSVVAIPSRQEPFGMVALEAMAAGKPVVATCVGGLPEVLEGADALLVPPDNPIALAQAIMTVLQRLDVDPGFGARNRDLAARFSASHMVEKYAALYEAC